ncbi:MAG: sugar phosphate nucleotidyltransferase [Candidatus Zixiibacteriota bacterium]
MKNLAAIILAAGKGSRMGGKFPKVLAQLKDKALIDYVIETVDKLNPEKKIAVVGFMKERVIEHIGNDEMDFAEQKKLLGTADAVRCALPELDNFDGDVMVLCGDVPLIPLETLEKILSYHRLNKMQATVLTVKLEDPAKYGRIVRDDNNMLEKIVEAADASEENLQIDEINSGMYVFTMKALRDNIDTIDAENAQGEFYLTDIIELLKKNGERVGAYLYEGKPELLFGVNRPDDLENLEEFLNKN